MIGERTPASRLVKAALLSGRCTTDKTSSFHPHFFELKIARFRQKCPPQAVSPLGTPRCSSAAICYQHLNRATPRTTAQALEEDRTNNVRTRIALATLSESIRHKIYKEQKIDSISVLSFGQNNSDSSKNVTLPVRSRFSVSQVCGKTSNRHRLLLIFPQLPGLEIGSLWTGAKWVFGISSLPRREHCASALYFGIGRVTSDAFAARGANVARHLI